MTWSLFDGFVTWLGRGNFVFLLGPWIGGGERGLFLALGDGFMMNLMIVYATLRRRKKRSDAI